MENEVQNTAPSEVQSEAQTPSTGAKDKLKLRKIIALVCGGVLLIALIGVAIYLLAGQDQTTVVTSSTDGTAISLVEGKNKITQGGTYTFTGTVADGKITVDTTADVHIILKNVSITNKSGAAIKAKGTGKVTVELVGENTLVSADTNADPAGAISSEGSLVLLGEGSAKITSNGKGVKAESDLLVSGGTWEIAAEDDALHSNGNITIDGGTFTLSTGDDAIHADGTLVVNNGEINIIKSHEGIEANAIAISGGKISVVADDDGINAQNSDGSTMIGVSGDSSLVISGGEIYVNADGDGLDSNGSIEISGGAIYVDGPTSDGDGAIDCDGEISITGGTLIAVGSAGMAMNATSATQPSILINLSSTYTGELSFGGITYTPAKRYGSVLISSPDLKVGASYELVIDGSTVQTVEVTTNIIGSGGMMGGFGGGMQGGPGMQDGGMQGGGRRF